MAGFDSNTTKDGLPPDITGNPKDDENSALNQDCVMEIDGDYWLVRPTRDPKTKEIINYKKISEITKADLNNKNLIPATWTPKGKLSLKQAKAELHKELVAVFSVQDNLDKLFGQLNDDSSAPVTKDSSLEEILASSQVPVDTKLMIITLASVSVEASDGSGRRTTLWEEYKKSISQSKEETQLNKHIQKYISSLKKVTDAPKVQKLNVSPDGLPHKDKTLKVDYYHLPTITKNPALKADKNHVYLGGLFSNNPLLNGDCEEITALSNQGKVPLADHRDNEISTISDILSKKNKSNIMVVGDAGVGKTFLVYSGVSEAQKRLAKLGQPLIAFKIDLQKLVNAGSGLFGEYQKKLFNLINSSIELSNGIDLHTILLLKNHNIDMEWMDKIIHQRTPMGTIPASKVFYSALRKVISRAQAEGRIPKFKVVWYIDEFHQSAEIGRNGNDATPALDILKPYLETGEITIIGSTTADEYDKYNKDPALKGRFHKLLVRELSPKQTFDILKTRAEKLQHQLKKEGHPIQITDKNLWTIISEAGKHLVNVKNPRASKDLLDTCIAAVKNKNYFQSQEMSSLELLIEKHEQALQSYDKSDVKYDLYVKELNVLKEKYAIMEKELHARIAKKIKQGGVTFSAHDIRASVARIMDLNPVMFAKDKPELISLFEDLLDENIVGHEKLKARLVDDYINQIAPTAGNKKAPSVFLFLGKPGTGKTEFGRVLSRIQNPKEALTDYEIDSYKVIAMNKYAAPGSATDLFGTQKGYIGYGESTELLSWVKTNPQGVLILDEWEKAHPSIQQMFLQIFETGEYTDGTTNQKIKFSGLTIILTSNALEKLIEENPDITTKELKANLAVWKPGKSGDLIDPSSQVPPFTGALMSRIGNKIYPFSGLKQAEMFKLVELTLSKLSKEIRNTVGLELDFGQYTPEYKKLRAKLDEQLKTVTSKKKAREMISAFEKKYYKIKYDYNSIVYKLLDIVVENGADGRFVGQCIDEQIKTPLNYISTTTWTNRPSNEDKVDDTKVYLEDLENEKLKVTLDDNNEIHFDIDGLEKQILAKKKQQVLKEKKSL